MRVDRCHDLTRVSIHGSSPLVRVNHHDNRAAESGYRSADLTRHEMTGIEMATLKRQINPLAVR